MRIDRFLSNLKYGSRSDIKEMMANDRVICEGNIVRDSATLIDPDHDLVEIDGQPVFYRKWIYLMMNKPQGVLSANKDAKQKTVLDLIQEPFSRFDLDLCGRLDIDTEGLLLLTNDGDFLHQIISPKKDILKHYEAELAQPLGDYSLLKKGLTLLDGKNQPYQAKPAILVPLTPQSCRISIGEGKFHEVKRMFEAIGNEVVHLRRVAIGGLVLDPALPLGGYREVSFSEAQAVFR